MPINTAAGTRICLKPEDTLPPTKPSAPEPEMPKTNVIEVVVIGATGSGKSHVLDTLAKALRCEYGTHAQITSHELSLKKGLGHELLKPRIADTIFNLREQGSTSSSKNGEMKISIDTSDLVTAIDKVEATQGQAMSFALDPLEQAVESTARVLRDEHQHMAQIGMTMAGNFPSTPIYRRMTDHLDLLLAAQLKRVTADETV
jgi:ABC-type branched-subunit amino acid transport system ATPase component